MSEGERGVASVVEGGERGGGMGGKRLSQLLKVSIRTLPTGALHPRPYSHPYSQPYSHPYSHPPPHPPA